MVKIIQCIDNISITAGNAYSPQQNPTRTYLGRHRGTKLPTFTFPVAKRTRAKLLPSLKVHHLSHTRRSSTFSLVSQEAMAMALKQPFNAHADVHWPVQRAALKLVHLLCNLTGLGITWEMHL